MVGGFSSGGVVVVKCVFPRTERGGVIVKNLMQRGFFSMWWGNVGIWSTTSLEKTYCILPIFS